LTFVTAPRRTLLITGCSSGIGLDAARGMRDRGWHVFASCRSEEDCARLRAEGFDSPRIDYTDTASIADGLAQTLAATGGRLDALFNNGAYGLPGAVEDLPREGLAAIFETNLFGYHDLTRRVIPVMRAQGHGRIVNCSSVLGLAGMRWRGAYVATKFAMEGLSDVLRLEMRGTGIHIILIEPGPITSDIRRKSIPHFERWIDWKSSARSGEYETLLHRLYGEKQHDRWELPASAVTAKLVHALESPRPRPRYWVTTPTYIVGTLKRLLPTRAADWLTARI
jgi:NAD(P)-dependent dehydrogenase (short-subunit alcohol dehydrogenase family)